MSLEFPMTFFFIFGFLVQAVHHIRNITGFHGSFFLTHHFAVLIKHADDIRV